MYYTGTRTDEEEQGRKYRNVHSLGVGEDVREDVCCACRFQRLQRVRSHKHRDDAPAESSCHKNHHGLSKSWAKFVFFLRNLCALCALCACAPVCVVQWSWCKV